MSQSIDRKEWIIIVAQNVKGKSKFPKNYGFTRYKPFPYKNSNELHRIVYARYFIDSEENAKELGKKVEQAMFQTYILSLAQTQHTCVQDYVMALHDITSNTSQQLASTIHDNDSKNPAYLFDKVYCSNKLLSSWGIVKGFK